MPLPASLKEVIRIDAARLGEGLRYMPDMGFVDFTFPGDMLLAEIPLLNERDISGGKQNAEQLITELSLQGDYYSNITLGQTIATGLAAGPAVLIMHIAGIRGTGPVPNLHPPGRPFRAESKGLEELEEEQHCRALEYAQTQAGMRKLLVNYYRNWKILGYDGYPNSHGDEEESYAILADYTERLLYTK